MRTNHGTNSAQGAAEVVVPVFCLDFRFPKPVHLGFGTSIEEPTGSDLDMMATLLSGTGIVDGRLKQEYLLNSGEVESLLVLGGANHLPIVPIVYEPCGDFDAKQVASQKLVEIGLRRDPVW